MTTIYSVASTLRDTWVEALRALASNDQYLGCTDLLTMLNYPSITQAATDNTDLLLTWSDYQTLRRQLTVFT